jgi:hypothetical protein
MSLLGLGGGGGLSASATSGASTGGIGPITVNNGGAPITTKTLLIIGGCLLAGLLTFVLLHARR